MQMVEPKSSQFPVGCNVLKAGSSGERSWAHFLAGAMGGMATSILTSPLDVLRTRLQTDIYKTQLQIPILCGSRSASVLLSSSAQHVRETFQILRMIRKTEGFRSFFAGLGPSLTGIVPATAIKFYTYGNCKRFLSEYSGYGKDAAVIHVIAAASAGVVTSTTTNPIWLIKTRMQLDGNGLAVASGVTRRKYRSSIGCLRQILKLEGFKGLYRGLTASYLGVLESTLHLVLYEQMKQSVPRRHGKALEAGASPERTQISELSAMGAIAGVAKLAAVSIAYPHEVIRTRLRQAPMANGLQRYTGIYQCFCTIWKEEGVLALYGGLTPHLLRAVPAAAITLGVYESTLRYFDIES